MEKKPVVRFFLNKYGLSGFTMAMIKGKTTTTITRYQLYIYVTYNRKNMQFKSRFGGYYLDLDEVAEKDKGLMAFEERVIQKIIQYEVSQMADPEMYSMKGLGTRYEKYVGSIFQMLEDYLKPRLTDEINKTKDDMIHALNLSMGSGENHVSRLYKVAAKIFPKFQSGLNKKLKQEIETYLSLLAVLRTEKYNCPTIIDWIDGSYKTELTQLLNKKYRGKSQLQTDIFKLIGAALDHRTKEKK
jgi:hypothetical protein